MKKITTKGKKVLIGFSCEFCGEEWNTDEYTYSTALDVDRSYEEKRTVHDVTALSMCDTCENLTNVNLTKLNAKVAMEGMTFSGANDMSDKDKAQSDAENEAENRVTGN